MAIFFMISIPLLFPYDNFGENPRASFQANKLCRVTESLGNVQPQAMARNIA